MPDINENDFSGQITHSEENKLQRCKLPRSKYYNWNTTVKGIVGEFFSRDWKNDRLFGEEETKF